MKAIVARPRIRPCAAVVPVLLAVVLFHARPLSAQASTAEKAAPDGGLAARQEASAQAADQDAAWRRQWQAYRRAGTRERPLLLADYSQQADQGDRVSQYVVGTIYWTGTGVRKDKVEALRWFRKAARLGLVQSEFFLGSLYAADGRGVIPAEEAFQWLQRASEHGQAGAKIKLANIYFLGLGRPKDLPKAITLFHALALSGDPRGQCAYGLCLKNGTGLPKDAMAGLQWIRKAAENGHHGAKKALAEAYATGEGVPVDLAEALRWYVQAAADGDPESQCMAGYLYQTGRGTPVKLAEALRLYRQAAAQDSAFAQYRLGRMYEKGEGVRADVGKAFRYYQRAADQDFADAQFSLGYLYEEGPANRKNHGKALEWYRRAAKNGSGSAMVNIGNFYYDGVGTAQDRAEASKWYRRAADAGDRDGKFNLGTCYQFGYGVPKDISRAVELLRQAAADGDHHAEWKLGRFYLRGEGVPKDRQEARRWFELAAKHGNADAKQELKKLDAGSFKRWLDWGERGLVLGVLLALLVAFVAAIAYPVHVVHDRLRGRARVWKCPTCGKPWPGKVCGDCAPAGGTKTAYAGLKTRVPAVLIDTLLWVLIELGLMYLRPRVIGGYEYLILREAPDWLVVGLGVWLVARTGQTPGKALVGIKVVGENLKPPGGRAALIRSSVLLLTQLAGLGRVLFKMTSVPTGRFNTMDEDAWDLLLENQTAMWIQFWLIALWYFAQSVAIRFDGKRRALHDRLAGTVVVETGV